MRKSAKFWIALYLFGIIGFSVYAQEKQPPRRVSGGGTAGYLIPDGCYKASYTCVLKWDAGGPFFCQKHSKQRSKDARSQPRRIKRIQCAARYPAVLKPKPQQEE